MLYHTLLAPTVCSDVNGQGWRKLFNPQTGYLQMRRADGSWMPGFTNNTGKAILHLQNGDVTITGMGAGENAPYVQNLTVNGLPWNKPWIRFPDISRGGTLVYRLNTTANQSWGSDPADAPPSYTDGMGSLQ